MCAALRMSWEPFWRHSKKHDFKISELALRGLAGKEFPELPTTLPTGHACQFPTIFATKNCGKNYGKLWTTLWTAPAWSSEGLHPPPIGISILIQCKPPAIRFYR